MPHGPPGTSTGPACSCHCHRLNSIDNYSILPWDHSRAAERRSPMSSKSQALAKVTEFDKGGGGTDWLLVKKTDLVAGLKDRLNSPDHIHTPAVTLCGPGAFFRYLA